MPPGRNGIDRMRVLVNGEERYVRAETTLLVLLAELEMDARNVAVAVNSSVVPKSDLGARGLAEGDRVEIIEAVGGG